MSSTAPSPTLRRRLALLFAGLAVVTVVMSVVAVVAAFRLYGAQEEVVRTLFRGYVATEDLRQALLDQESAFGGFALSRDEEDLAPYDDGRNRERDAQQRLATVEEQFPSLRARRDAVTDAVQEWRTQSAVPGIDALRAGGALGPGEIEAGEQRFDEVRAAVDAYRTELLRLREDRADDLYLGVRILNAVLIAGLVLLVLAAVAIRLALRRWVLEPLEQLGAEVERVEQGDLSRRVDTDESAPAEVRHLAEQVDRMRMRILQEFALAEQARIDAQRAHETVEEQAEDLRRSNAELEQFAYVASHDLQEPLRKVASFCQLIERRYKGQLDERGEQYIEFAVDGAKRMQQLINDLLAFSRVGRSTSDFETVDLEEVMRQAERQLSSAIDETGALVTHDRLPQVRGDASLLVQLLQNLVGNGVKFRSEAAPRVHIGVRRSPSDEAFWEMSCTDNGIGIDPAYEDKIFVIFQRLHGRDAYGGTGIGLAMCKKIVEHHGGRLWLDSSSRGGTEAGTGSTFRWTLPVVDSSPAPARSGDGTGERSVQSVAETNERTTDDAAARATG